MEGEVVGSPTLQSVNDKLLRKIDERLNNADSLEVISILSDSVAKLNSSYRNNDFFPRPETNEERKQREIQEALRGAMNGDN